jgi:hypothetical protein
MPIPLALVSRYFQLLVNRRFAEAERELERIKLKMHKTEWNRGYFSALYGMLRTRRANNDGSYAFFSRLDFSDKTVLQEYRKEFLGHVRNKLHGDFDRGFFSAWADCMRVLSKMEFEAAIPKTNVISNDDQIRRKSVGEGQATIEKFLKGTASR